VVAAALHNYFALSRAGAVAIVELKRDLACQDNREIDSVGLVMGKGETGRKLANVHQRAAAREIFAA
jgi:hypothetical protein